LKRQIVLSHEVVMGQFFPLSFNFLSFSLFRFFFLFSPYGFLRLAQINGRMELGSHFDPPMVYTSMVYTLGSSHDLTTITTIPMTP
jgi:hypothetical protein